MRVLDADTKVNENDIIFILQFLFNICKVKNSAIDRVG